MSVLMLLAVVLVLAASVLVLISKDTKDHLVAFFLPFMIDCSLTCPTSEAVADILLADKALLAQLEGKIAIVTGCTLGGIGATTAGILAGRAGMHVVCAGRTLSKLEECAESVRKAYPGATLTCLRLDVSSFASVRAFVDDFSRAFPSAPLALLVNNAGIMAAPYAKSVDGFELQMATNHLGPFLLTCLLVPRLKAAAKAHPGLGSRVVNVASMAHAVFSPHGARPLPLNKEYRNFGPFGKFLAYGRTKRANILSALALARRLKGSGVCALSLCPGNVRTNLGQNNFGAWVVYKAFFFLHKTCSQGAATTIHACLNQKFAAQSGAYLIHDQARTTAGCSEDVAEVLWRESAGAVGLTATEETEITGA